MATDDMYEGWVGEDKSSAEGKMVWKQFVPKVWEETDVEIKITHSGVCGSDVHTLRSGWVSPRTELNGIPWQEPRTDNNSAMSRTQSSSGMKSSASPSGLAPRRRETSRSATLWAWDPRPMRVSTAMPTTLA